MPGALPREIERTEIQAAIERRCKDNDTKKHPETHKKKNDESNDVKQEASSAEAALRIESIEYQSDPFTCVFQCLSSVDRVRYSPKQSIRGRPDQSISETCAHSRTHVSKLHLVLPFWITAIRAPSAESRENNHNRAVQRVQRACYQC